MALVRGAWGAVERKEKLFILHEELHKLIKADASKDQLDAKLNMVIRYESLLNLGAAGDCALSTVFSLLKRFWGAHREAKEYEKYRAISEMTIHDRWVLQPLIKLHDQGKRGASVLLECAPSAIAS